MRAVRRTVVAGIGVSVVFSLLAVAPAMAGPPGRAASAEHQRIVTFWTKERMAAARPREVVLAGQRRIVPAAKADATLAAAATTGSPWPDGKGLVYRATGRILFAMGGQYWQCSGTVVTETASNRSIVLSAGHCAYDQAAKQFATEWMFIPEYDTSPVLFDCPNTPRGCWTASALVVSAGFANRGGFDTTAAQSDWAFAVLGPGGKGATPADLATTVGSFPISFSSVGQNTQVSAFGYPAGAPYDGTELIQCQGALRFDLWTLNRTNRLPCTMTGGSSGGPWFRSFASSGDSGTLMSVNSYTYPGGGSMYGPKFTARTQAAFNAALTTLTSVVVP